MVGNAGAEPDGSGGDGGMGWESALVAAVFLIMVGAVAVAAIVRYSIDDALRIWTPLVALLGTAMGGLVSYFFTRTATAQARARAREAERRAARAEAQLEEQRAGRDRQERASSLAPGAER